MLTVKVTKEDIAHGKRQDCFNCPVAKALGRATKDDNANVYERDWTMYLEVWSRSMPAPRSVVEFVSAFDQDSKPHPFSFKIPPQASDEWLERCGVCEELCKTEALNEDGDCEECVVKSSLCAK